jgi:hypothetical protein
VLLPAIIQYYPAPRPGVQPRRVRPIVLHAWACGAAAAAIDKNKIKIYEINFYFIF